MNENTIDFQFLLDKNKQLDAFLRSYPERSENDIDLFHYSFRKSRYSYHVSRLSGTDYDPEWMDLEE